MRKNILILGHNDATQFIDIYNQYTRLFDKEKFEVTVAYLTGEPSETVKNRTIAENVIFLNAAKKNIRGFKILPILNLIKLCRAKKFQTVICHRYKPSYIMMWVARFVKIPAVIMVMHELDTLSSWRRRLAISILQRENMIFAGVSNAVRDDMRKSLWRVPEDRIITLYNMIDVDLTEPQLLSRADARKVLQIPEHAFVFGNVARLAPNKDQVNLIKAFALIKPYCPNAKLIIIGDGQLDSQLKQTVDLNRLTDDVIFTGFLTGGFRYMKAFDCFVLSSIQEAFGRVLLEAMIARLPIIATKVHGIPEVVGDAGRLVEAKDTEAIAAAMKEIYHASEQQRESIGTQGYQRAMEHFSIPKFYEQFWQLPFLQSVRDA